MRKVVGEADSRSQRGKHGRGLHVGEEFLQQVVTEQPPAARQAPLS